MSRLRLIASRPATGGAAFGKPSNCENLAQPNAGLNEAGCVWDLGGILVGLWREFGATMAGVGCDATM